MVMTDRDRQIAQFLAAHGWDGTPQVLHGDASQRRFLRLTTPDRSAVLMDAALPEHRTGAFLALSALLNRLGLSAPQVLAVDAARGLVLLEDFGDARMGARLDDGVDPAPLLDLAVDVLIELQRTFTLDDPAAAALPRYDAAQFLDQLDLFPQLVPAHYGLPGDAAAAAAFRAAWTAPLHDACEGPQSLLLRDYFADNLMLLPDRPGVRACGLLDFQDAGIGPVAYDLVSLLEDARRDIAPAHVARCLERYRAAFPYARNADFAHSYNVLAAVRHCRIIAVFVRLAGSGREQYLNHLPRLWRLFERHLGEPSLQPVAAWLDIHLPKDRRTG